MRIMQLRTRLWFARLAIGLVFVWNVQCALAFLLSPEVFSSGFELTGSVGEATVRGVGLLFLMWKIPYAVALWHPVRHHTSLYEAIAMQTIGLLGETYILLNLPAMHLAYQASLQRFIGFDGSGLVLLLLALWLVYGHP